VLGELGDTLGWRYLFWNCIDRFLSPVPAAELSCPFPESVQFTEIALPARRAYEQLRETSPDPRRFLVVCGYWGQGPMIRITSQILETVSDSRVDVVCGENTGLHAQASRVFRGNHRVALHGCVDSMLPLMRGCAAIVTKPGISTLLEAHAAKRKIFLLRGMPVAEDNNARYFIRNFGAEWFSIDTLRRWSTRKAG
jgi:UDP-N-acetylglucosamine:LPS N-acetylglucosamine transferase